MNKYLGCLFGLAIGDALGAPVEFLSLESIKEEYGTEGITDLHEWSGFRAGSYTDDTQMALATSKACIRYHHERDEIESDPASIAHEHYLEWLESQKDSFNFRAPGKTCLNSLMSGRMGTITDPINKSKGCGGVMRTAPVGLVFPGSKAFRIGAEFGAITHGHPSGFLPAGFIAELIGRIIEGRDIVGSIEQCTKSLKTFDRHNETLDKVQLAQDLVQCSSPSEECIPKIGTGWTGEEALGISLYCSLRFPDDFRKGVVAAVNHSGDSDSTGAITGAILGTLNGIEAILEKWVREVEDSGVIRRIAEEMFNIHRNY